MTEWLVYFLILAVLISFSASALYGFYWSAKHDQFRNLDKGAESIFGADEPIGTTTDIFPGELWARNARGRMVRTAKGLAK
jgi:cbb3-type cytochrome oxidase maturation protein